MGSYRPKVDASDRNYLNLKAALFIIDHRLSDRGRGFKNASEAYEWTFNLRVTSDIFEVSGFVFMHAAARIDVRQEIEAMRGALK